MTQRAWCTRGLWHIGPCGIHTTQTANPVRIDSFHWLLKTCAQQSQTKAAKSCNKNGVGRKTQYCTRKSHSDYWLQAQTCQLNGCFRVNHVVDSQCGARKALMTQLYTVRNPAKASWILRELFLFSEVVRQNIHDHVLKWYKRYRTLLCKEI